MGNSEAVPKWRFQNETSEAPEPLCGSRLNTVSAHNWEDEWVETAENLVREEWIDQYKDRYMCESTLDSANKNGTKVREVAILHTSIHSLC